MAKVLYGVHAYDKMLETSKSKLVVVDFTADWCGPCQYMAPIFEKMAEEMPDVEFRKVDTDESHYVTKKCGIEAMPAFVCFKGGQKVADLRGADANALKAMVASHK